MSSGARRLQWHLAAAVACALLAVSALPADGQRQPGASPRSQAPAFFTATLPVDAMRGKQAVLDTDRGVIVIDLLPDAAPNHVAYFMKLAGEGAYDGTTFHRAIKYGIVQGGDPLSKDPSRRAQYGTGGLGVLRREPNAERHTRGAVSAVLQPGRPDSAGAQFFICVTDQPALDGAYTVFGRVFDGIEVVQAISEAATDADGRVIDRVVIRTVTIRDRPPEPFSTEPDTELGLYRVVFDTTFGPIGIELFADRAPGHVRAVLRLAALGVYTGTAFHRVVAGFVAQAGLISTRALPLTERQQRAIVNLRAEFNDTRHERGVVSMARLDDPDSAQTSFFVVLGPQPSLDGKYTVFGRVVEGMDVVEAIEKAPVDGETPRTRIEITGVRIERRGP